MGLWTFEDSPSFFHGPYKDLVCEKINVTWTLHNARFIFSSVLWMEKGMAVHSSILVWRTSWTEEPGELLSMRSQRVRYDRSDSAHCVVEPRSHRPFTRFCRRSRLSCLAFARPKSLLKYLFSPCHLMMVPVFLWIVVTAKIIMAVTGALCLRLFI